MKVGHIDWAHWQPTAVAALGLVIQEQQALVIRKKRGLGKGKITPPGGHVEAGESPLQAMQRELVEEVGLFPKYPRTGGLLQFHFLHGLRLQTTVFTSEATDGRLTETEEALPFWVPLDEMPYAEMWADDLHWIPPLLAGRVPFSGRFILDGDRLLDAEMQIPEPERDLLQAVAASGIGHRLESHAPRWQLPTGREVTVFRRAQPNGASPVCWLGFAEERATLEAALGPLYIGAPEPRWPQAKEDLSSWDGLWARWEGDEVGEIGLSPEVAAAPDVALSPKVRDRSLWLSGAGLRALWEGRGWKVRGLDLKGGTIR